MGLGIRFAVEVSDFLRAVWGITGGSMLWVWGSGYLGRDF